MISECKVGGFEVVDLVTLDLKLLVILLSCSKVSKRSPISDNRRHSLVHDPSLSLISHLHINELTWAFNVLKQEYYKYVRFYRNFLKSSTNDCKFYLFMLRKPCVRTFNIVLILVYLLTFAGWIWNCSTSKIQYFFTFQVTSNYFSTRTPWRSVCWWGETKRGRSAPITTSNPGCCSSLWCQREPGCGSFTPILQVWNHIKWLSSF